MLHTVLQVQKRVQGEWQFVTERLTPGYIYLSTRDIVSVSQALYGVPSFTKLLGNDGGFIPLRKDEIAWLDSLTTQGNRVVEMSVGVIEGDKVVIQSGPLQGLEGQIVKIDRHKRLAYLDMRFMGRMKTIRVGLEIVRKQ